MGEFLELLGLLAAAFGGDNITGVFFWIILGTFIAYLVGPGRLLDILMRRPSPRSQEGFSKSAPSVLTSLGILGTFSGVFYGLEGFAEIFAEIDNENLESSRAAIRRLVSGLQIAFSTSILGLALALLYRVIYDHRHRSMEKNEVGAEDLRSELQSIREALDGLSRILTKDMIESIVRALMTKLDETLKDLRESIERLIEWQRNHLEHMRQMESRMDALIDRLETRMVAVFKLMDEHINNMTMRIESMTLKMEAMTLQLEHVSEKMVAMTQKMEKSVHAIQGAEVAIISIQDAVARISEAVEKVKEDLRSIPDMLKPVGSLVERMDRHSREMETTLNTFARLGDEAVDSISKVRQSTEEISAFSGRVEEVIRKFQKSADDINGFASAAGSAMESFQQLTREFAEIAESSAKVSRNVEHSVKTLETEMQKALDVMARHLGSISNAFAKDYEPILAESRRMMVEIRNLWAAARSLPPPPGGGAPEGGQAPQGEGS